jgi:hypothetical protein
MSYDECLEIKKTEKKTHMITDGSKKFFLLVTPETPEYFKLYNLNERGQNMDHHARSYAFDNKYILRWMATDGSSMPYYQESNS